MESKGQIHRHAAIMFTDIVGYTALMGSDEDKAFNMLARNRSIHETHIKQFNGTLIKEIGDGTLISFNLASDAVRCAIEIQKACKEQDIPLKIGIHEGEMVFAGADVLGDSVNIASRLQEDADEGCIDISSSVYKDIRNKADINTRFIGEKVFKNVDEPVKVYEVLCEGIEEGKKPEISPTKENKKSIAVLPFVNMSNDPEQEYFCDGISEEIINALTHVESLKVIARTSAFMFKGRHEDMREIGRKLDVETLLEGSVRKAGDDLRITAQLINVIDGTHIWSEAYNRKMEDVFSIQEDISLAITDVLNIKLLGNEKKAMVKRHTEDLEAYNLYLKGMYCERLFTAEGFKEALDYFGKSLSIDPNFLLAYYGLAHTYCKITFFGGVPPNDGYMLAKGYLQKALAIDNSAAEVHATMGLYIHMIYNWNWIAAEEEIKKALQLNPNCADTHYSYSYFLLFNGHYEEAILEAKRSVELYPLSGLYNATLGAAYFYGHQADKSIEVLEKVIKMNTNDWLALYHLGHTYEGESMLSNAINAYKKCAEITGGHALPVSSLACCYYLIGEIDKADKIYNDLEQRSKSEYIPATMIYSYHNIKGDLDQAFYWLKKAVKEHDSFLLWMTICPTLGHAIPDEPRFKELMAKVRFHQ